MNKLGFPIVAITISAAWLTAPVSAAPPEEIFEFTVITDTLQTPPQCLGNPACTITEGRVPYLLGTLTLTHDALTQHQAQLSDQTNPPTDDGRVISFSVPNNLPGGLLAPGSLDIPATNPLCPSSYTDRLFQTIPPCSFIVRLQIDGDGYTLDLGPIIGNHLSGVIDIVDEQPHGDGCVLRMQGGNGNWSGTWACTIFGFGTLHSFTAIAMQVNGHVAQK
jgi:hypothetical protein